MRGIDARSGIVLLLLSIFGVRPATAQPMNTTLPEYHVTVDPDSFAFILQFPHEDLYISAEVSSGGITYTGVRMRIRGDSSRNLPKKSFKLEFTGRALPDGTRTLNLNADYQDESYLHTVLSSILMRRSGQPVFDARHALLYVNGSFSGIYLQVENMDEAFLARVGLDPQGNLYKATLDGACLSPFDDVLYHWEKKTNENDPRHDLVSLIGTINSVPQSDYEAFARDWFDYDAMVNVLAMNMLIANGSTYYHNYYMYHDVRGSGKWMYLPWDTDFSFASYGIAYDYRRSSGSGTPDNPFLERAIVSESILADIRARVEELRVELFDPAVVNPIIDSIATVIAPYVPLDSFDSVLDVQEWESRVQSEKHFLEIRPANLLRQLDEGLRSFLLVRESESTPDGITFRWGRSVSPTGLPVRYSLVFARSTAFNSLTDRVFRDLSDTTFTLTPLPAPGRYFWWVTATDGTSSVDGYDTWNPLIVGPSVDLPIVINEILYDGGDVVGSEDWVELHNPNSDTVDVSGWRLDDGPNRYLIPQSTSIEPGGFLVFARNTDAFAGWYPGHELAIGEIGFGLSANGDMLRLVNRLQQTVDSVTFQPGPPWPADAAGSGLTLSLRHPSLDNSLPESWTASQEIGGTPGRTNFDAPTPIEVVSGRSRVALRAAYPDPFTDGTTIGIELDVPADVRLVVTDLLGRRVRVLLNGWHESGVHAVYWEAAGVASGIYFVTMEVNGEPRGRVRVTVVR